MKKITVLTVLLVLGILPFCFAQERVVAVTSEKEIDIQGDDVASARTVALAAAARDAVEKAYGTYVKIEELPDSRTVIAQTAASLQYKILAEQQRGKKYWVKIQASVAIPAQYVLDQSNEREELGEAMENFVQKYPQGEVNWGEGFVLAYGKGVIASGHSEEEAARAAEVDAKAHLLEIIHDIPVDDRSKAGQDQRMSFALEGFVQGAEVVTRSRSGATVNITMQASLRGIKGLSMTLYGLYTPPIPEVTEVIKPTPKKQPPKQTASKEPPKPKEFSGIVIDARAVPNAAPAVFPRVEDTQKREVYGVQKVNQEDLQKRGMASYAVVAREVKISKLYPNAIIIPVSYSPDAPQTQEKPRRQGYAPLTVKASTTKGQLNSTLTISDEDAQKIVDADDESGALKHCRVVIVVPSEKPGM
jgi:hypothetical protein